MTWKGFQHYWPFVRGFLRSTMDSHLKWPVRWSLGAFFVVSLTMLSICLRFEAPWRACDVTVIWSTLIHYSDVIVGTIASQITSLAIVYSTVYWSADQRKHQSSAPLTFVRGIHRRPVNSPHKWPVTRKMFPFDDVIMILSHRLWHIQTWTKRVTFFAKDVFKFIYFNWKNYILIHSWGTDKQYISIGLGNGLLRVQRQSWPLPYGACMCHYTSMS